MDRAISPMSGAGPSITQHACHHPNCDRWGAWGYDPGEGVTQWWCLEHRPDHDPVRTVVEQNWVSDGNEG